MKTLVAGPWIGEFGWELFCWQSYLRARSREFDRTIVYGRPGHEAIYEDFATEYQGWMVPRQGRPDCQNLIIEGKKWPGWTETNWCREATRIRPNDVPIVWDPVPRVNGPQEWKRYGDSEEAVFSHPVVFHARSRQWNADRNWPEDEWYELAHQLSIRDIGFSCIGTEEEAMWIEREIGAPFMAKTGLKSQMNEISGAKVAVGPSSGPMALAVLCGTPVVTWSGNEKDLTRLPKVWNPFNVPVKVLPTWQPSVESVRQAILETLGV